MLGMPLPILPEQEFSPMVHRISSRAIILALLASFLVVSCWDDETSPTGPGAPPADTTHRDTSKIDTSKKDTANKDTTRRDTSKVDTTGKVVGPAGTDSLAPGQKSKDLQLGGVVGSGKSVTWVKFQGTSGHTYTFTYLPRGGGTLQVYLLNGKDTLAQVSTPRTGDSIVFPCTRAGTYLVKVVGPAGTKPTLKVGENDLLPMYVVSGDGFEPDYDTAHATTWDFKNPSQYHTTHYTGVMDTDWVRVKVDSGTTLTLNLEGTFTMVSSIGRPQLDGFEPDGQPVRWNGSEGYRTLAVFQSRTLYLRLCGHDTISMPYTLSISTKNGFPATAFLPDAFEPDQTPDKAVPLGLDTTGLSRSLHGDEQTDDVDWMRIQADSGWVYRFLVETKYEKDYPLVELRSPQQVRQILKDSLVDRWGASRAWSFACTKTSEYFLRIEGKTATDYRVRLSKSANLPAWTSVPDSLEPDDVRAQAVVLGKGRRKFDRTLTSGDVDWYAVDVPAKSVWVFMVASKAPKNIESYVTVYDADSVRVAGFQIFGGSREGWGHRFQEAGRYYLQVWGKLASGSLKTDYTLESSVFDDSDASEPDSLPSQGQILTPDGNWRTRSVSYGDQDWMTVPLKASSRLVLDIQKISPSDEVQVAMFGGSDAVATGASIDGVSVPSDSLRDSLSIFVPRDSTVRFRIEGSGGGDALGAASYRLRARVETLNPDAQEPDQTQSDAKVLAPDTTWSHRTLFPGDEDWVAIDAPAGKIFNLQTRSAAYSTDPRLKVRMILPWGGEQSLYWNSTRYATYLRNPGRFYLQFKLEGFSPTVVDYEVRATLEDYPDRFEPDDEASEAKPLVLDSTSQAHRFMVGDAVDWIRIPGAGRARRYVQVSTGYGGMTVESHRLDGTLVKTFTEAEARAGLLLANLQDTATYLVRVSGSNGTEYSVRGWKVVDPDPFEASDSPDLAPSLSGVPTTRWIAKNDTDLFRIHLEPGQTASMTVSGKVRWNLLSTAGQSVANALSGGQPYEAASVEDYLVRVLPTEATDAFLPYSMALLPLQRDSSARHRARTEAIVVASPDSLLRSALTAYTDTVWYRIHLEPDRKVVLQAGSAGRIAVFTQDQKPLRDSLGSLTLFYHTKSDTALYVGFVPRRDSFQLMPISLRVCNRLDDAYEPDNAIAGAKAIDSGVWQERVLMENDTDFIRLPTAADGTKWTMDLQFSEIEIGTEVTREDGVGTGQNGYLRSGQTTTLTTKGPGPCFLRLVGLNNILNPRMAGSRYRIRVVGK